MTEILNEKEYIVVLPPILEEEAIIWCDEQYGKEGDTWARKRTRLSGMYYVHSETFYFDNEEDAVAFKLRWQE